MILYTKSELEQMKAERVAELIEHAGSLTHLARMLDQGLQTVVGWQTRGQISMGAARKVAEHPTLGKKFPAEYLRPELETIAK